MKKIFEPFRNLILLTIMGVFFITLILPPSLVQSQGILTLPTPGTMVTTSSVFVPPILKGLIVHPQQPFQLDFVLDEGNSTLTEEEIKGESTKLIKYFLASLALPEDELWVNLSPYESDRIIPDGFGKTEMGRTFLAQDYLLKQLTASMIYPESELGEKFWDRVYKRVNRLYGTSEVPVNTFNKVWIIPDKAIIYENKDRAFVVEGNLKVMLDEDYLAIKNNHKNDTMGVNELSKNEVDELRKISSQVLKEVIIPEIELEVNHGKNFAKLRQIYYSFVLASWYKKNLYQTILNKAYSNKMKTDGLESVDSKFKDEIYNQYLDSFEKGVYDFIKEDYDENTKSVIARKYFSGGVKIYYKGEKQQERKPKWTGRVNVIKNLFENRKLASYIGSGNSPIHAAIEDVRQKIALGQFEEAREILISLQRGLTTTQQSQDIASLTEQWQGRYPSSGEVDLMLGDVPMALHDVEQLLSLLTQEQNQIQDTALLVEEVDKLKLSIIKMSSFQQEKGGIKEAEEIERQLSARESEMQETFSQEANQAIAEMYLSILPELYRKDVIREILNEGYDLILPILEKRIENYFGEQGKLLISRKYRNNLKSLLTGFNDWVNASKLEFSEKLERKMNNLPHVEKKEAVEGIYMALLDNWELSLDYYAEKSSTKENISKINFIFTKLVTERSSKVLLNALSRMVRFAADINAGIFHVEPKDAFVATIEAVKVKIQNLAPSSSEAQRNIEDAYILAFDILLKKLGESKKAKIDEELKSLEILEQSVLTVLPASSGKNKIAQIYLDAFPQLFPKMDRRYQTTEGNVLTFFDVFEKVQYRIKSLLGQGEGPKRIQSQIERLIEQQVKKTKNTMRSSDVPIREIFSDLEVRPNPLSLVGLGQDEIEESAKAAGLPVRLENIDSYLHNLKGLLPYFEDMIRQLLEEYRGNKKVYFVSLGRDMELFYDVLAAVLQGTELEDRVVLIPLSMRITEKLSIWGNDSEEFLNQFIDIEGIRNGLREYIIFDTGFKGNAIDWINNVIRVSLGEIPLGKNDVKDGYPLHGRLIKSSHFWYPEFRLDRADTMYTKNDFKFPDMNAWDLRTDLNQAVASATQLMPKYYGHTDKLKIKIVNGNKILIPTSSIVEVEGYPQLAPYLPSLEGEIPVSLTGDSIKTKIDWQSPIDPVAAVTIQAEVVNHFSRLRENILRKEGAWIAPQSGDQIFAAREETILDWETAYSGDLASLEVKKPGGIDFNPNLLEIESQGNKVHASLLNDFQKNQNVEVNILVPFIFSVTPVSNFSMLLGEELYQLH